MILLFILLFSSVSFSQSWIRINQLGYKLNSVKAAVFVSKDVVQISSFEIRDFNTAETVFKGDSIKQFGSYGAFKSSARLYFSSFDKEGVYQIKADTFFSPPFTIADFIYDGAADFLLQYMRQQRCGYNPFLKDSCHIHDGFIVDHPSRTGEHIDVTGAWHDATDYLQYVTTSATAAYQLLYAYKMNPSSFQDEFDASGDPGANGIADILDEAKWGLDWLIKMNPDSGVMFNQIADDRDHAGFRLPNHDSVSYGKGFERPVYFVTGKQQGICNYKNRTTGVSSTAGKFASSFALGAELFAEIDPEFSNLLKNKAAAAYDFAKTDLGVCQTASCKAPYFYEEDNYLDDLELAAAQLSLINKNGKYFTEAVEWGKIEPVTPWIGSDTARHYQWYPFVNIGHIILASQKDSAEAKLFQSYLQKGIDKIYQRGKENPFQIGIPFIWCSNNLIASHLIQLWSYRKITGDEQYAEMEAALINWLMGCNPWGTSMVVGFPVNGDSPSDPHSSLWVKYGYQTTGGLVDGPVYGSIFNHLKWLKIVNEDEYAEFQSDEHVYHDDYGDYSTNEPTMDGTASLIFYLAAMAGE